MDTGAVVDLNDHEHLAHAARIRELAAHNHAAEARLATELAAFTADGKWNASGDWRSLAHWLGLNCGYTRNEARAIQRVTNNIDAMPTVMHHARAGEVSLGVIAMAARVATPELDQTRANIVTACTPNQAGRSIAAYRTAKQRQPQPQPQPADEPDPNTDTDHDTEASRWQTWYDDDGMWNVIGRAPADVGAALDEAHHAAQRSAQRSTEHPAQPPDDDPTRGTRTPPPRPGVADVLRELADLVLDAANHHRLTRDGGEHFAVTVLIDLETLISGTLRPGSICQLESGPHVTPGLIRRFAESGHLQTLWHRGGIPLMLGTETRFATRAQRRALRYRDGGCSVPGCDATHHLHAHHLTPYPTGGTDIDNLILLCPFHHRRLHQGRLLIDTDGHQHFTFRTHTGDIIGNRLITHTRTRGRPPTGPIEHLPDQHTIPINGYTTLPSGGYDHLTDWALNVYVHTLLTATQHTRAASAEYAAAS